MIGSISGTGDIELASGVTLSAGADNSSTTFDGVISGAGSFTKQGTGTLSFSGVAPNAYTGATSVEAGRINLSGGSGLADTSALSVSSGATFDLDVSDVIGSISGVGDIDLASGVTLSAGADNSSTTFDGVISGAGSFTKQGTGTLSFSGVAPNAYTGATSVEAGRINLSGGSGLADTSALSVSSGATFDLDVSDVIGSISGVGDIDLASGAILSAGADNSSTTFDGVISGDGGFTKQGTGTLTFSGVAPNAYTLSLIHI